jgi:pimeloyl-ACP methyl ester carboxylesterase
MRSSLLFPLAALLASCTATTTQQAALPEPPLPALAAQTYGPARGPDVQTLLIVLNGDGTPGLRTDHYGFAQAAAQAIPASAAIAMLRPGYSDASGRTAPGERGSDTGDNYTPDRIAAIAEAVTALRARYPAARAILVGESGGAAIAANLAGVRPGLVDGMVLVGCPCTLPEWRQYMRRRMPRGGWDAAVTSLDPLKTAGGILPSIRAAVLVGADDAVTPVKFSRAYAEALTLRGIATDYRIVPGKGHDLLNDPEVLAATSRLAASLARKTI